MSDNRQLLIGKIVSVFGVDGWIKIESYTEPRLNLFRYSPWLLKQAGREWQVEEKVRGREQGKSIVGQLPGIVNRDQAHALVGTEIYVGRDVLPKAKPGEYYWSDLEGLKVTGEGGVELGKVSHLFSTGANDVLFVVDGERERLIPFVMDQAILSVDLDAGLIETNWDPDF